MRACETPCFALKPSLALKIFTFPKPEQEAKCEHSFAVSQLRNFFKRGCGQRIRRVGRKKDFGF